MSTALLVHSGTGNSLWTARALAASLDPAQVLPMNDSLAALPDADAVGLVFPVHMWGLPARVIGLVHRLQVRPEAYLFAVAVNAGQPAATLPQLSALLRGRALCLSAGFSVALPSNYIPWGGAPPAQVQERFFRGARDRIEAVALAVGRREERKMERGPAWQNPLFSLLYRMAFPHVRGMDKKFFSDERCNGCGICVRICPAGNVELKGEKPVWRHRCEQCLACLQWCPREAIQYGDKTRSRRRYHHPEVTLADMLALTGTRPPVISA
jgi:ferredoxin